MSRIIRNLLLPLLVLIHCCVGLLDPCNPGDYIVDITNDIIGEIEYPTGGASYPGSSTFCFRIQTTDWVHITWERMDIEDAYHCANNNICNTASACTYMGGFGCTFDSVTAYDNGGAVVKLCGTDGILPNWQPDSAGDVVFKFTSDVSNHHTGFKLSYRICSDPPYYGSQQQVEPTFCHRAYVGEYSGSTGNIKYPATGNYPPGDRKCWRLHCNGRLSLTWNTLAAEPHHGCVWDRVSVFDAQGKEHIFCERISAQNYPDSVEYPPGDLVIYFHSDLCSHDVGFDVDWTCNPWSWPAAPAVGTLWTPRCDTLNYDIAQNANPIRIIFPGSGATYSLSASLCIRLQCSGLVRITTFDLLDIQTSSHCNEDYMRFYQSGGIWSPSLCGQTSPTWTPTEMGDLSFIFRANGDANSGLGFEFVYTCDTTVSFTPPPAPPSGFVHIDTPVPAPTECQITAVPTAVPTLVPTPVPHPCDSGLHNCDTVGGICAVTTGNDYSCDCASGYICIAGCTGMHTGHDCSMSCRDYTCTVGYLKGSPETIACAGNLLTDCNDATCCSDPTLVPTPVPHPCDSGLHNCDTVGGICAVTTGNDYSCDCASGYICIAGCTGMHTGHDCSISCRDYTCTVGYLKGSPETIVCAGGLITDCNDATCCSDPTLVPTPVPHPCDSGLHNCDTVGGICAVTTGNDYSCDCASGYICIAGCTGMHTGHDCSMSCRDYTCTVGYLKGSPETIACAGNLLTDCNDATCCSDPTLVPTPVPHPCDSGLHNCDTVGGICAVTTGNDYSCDCASGYICIAGCTGMHTGHDCSISCRDYTCTVGYLKGSPETIVCAGGLITDCNDATCCSDPTLVPTPVPHPCDSGLHNCDTVGGICAVTTGNDYSCDCASGFVCIAGCTGMHTGHDCSMSCRDYTCTVGYLKGSPETIACAGNLLTDCNDATCCSDATLVPTPVPHPCDSGLHNCDTVGGICAVTTGNDYSCDCASGYICIAGCTGMHTGHDCSMSCRDYTCTVGYLKGSPETIACAGNLLTDCNDATCCSDATLVPTPVPHPCDSGIHSCDTVGGICIALVGSDFQCDCASGYVCTNGCSGMHTAHACSISCRDYTCIIGYLKSSPEMIACAGSLLANCDDATCCSDPTLVPTPVPHPCDSGLHNCDTVGGICAVTTGNDYSCDCASGFVCIAGCTGMHTGHDCSMSCRDYTCTVGYLKGSPETIACAGNLLTDCNDATCCSDPTLVPTPVPHPCDSGLHNCDTVGGICAVTTGNDYSCDCASGFVCIAGCTGMHTGHDCSMSCRDYTCTVGYLKGSPETIACAGNLLTDCNDATCCSDPTLVPTPVPHPCDSGLHNCDTVGGICAVTTGNDYSCDCASGFVCIAGCTGMHTGHDCSMSCRDYTCTVGYLKGSPETIACAGNLLTDCNDATCCSDPTLVPTPVPHPCDSGLHNCDTVGGICAVTTGNDYSCDCASGYICIAGCTGMHTGHDCSISCRDYTCTVGYLKGSPETIVCAGGLLTDCNDATCCSDATLVPTPVPHPCDSGIHSCDTVGGICIALVGSDFQCDCASGYVCTNGCSGMHTAHACSISCRDYTCIIGYLKSSPEMIVCAGSLLTDCNDATCCSDATLVPTPVPHPCDSGLHNCDTVGGICAVTTGNDYSCDCASGFVCIAGCTGMHTGHDCSMSCRDYTCTVGYLKGSPETIACAGNLLTDCNDATCCSDPTLVPTPVPHPCDSGLHNCDTVGGICAVTTGNDYSCDCASGFVCIAGCTGMHTGHDCSMSCRDYTCTVGYLKGSPETIACAGNLLTDCNDATCCSDPTLVPTPVPHPCDSGLHNCDTVGGICAVTTGNDYSCDCASGFVCIAGCTGMHTGHDCSMSCRDYTCTVGYLKGSPETIVCAGGLLTDCNDATCCSDATLVPTPVPHPCDSGIHSCDTVGGICIAQVGDDYSCDCASGYICIAGCTGMHTGHDCSISCRDYTCTVGYLKGSPETIVCAGGLITDCNDATCCSDPTLVPTPVPHPCDSGLHNCDTVGGICAVTTGNDYSCDCASGFVCIAGCTGMHTGHDCSMSCRDYTCTVGYLKGSPELIACPGKVLTDCDDGSCCSDVTLAPPTPAPPGCAVNSVVGAIPSCTVGVDVAHQTDCTWIAEVGYDCTDLLSTCNAGIFSVLPSCTEKGCNTPSIPGATRVTCGSTVSHSDTCNWEPQKGFKCNSDPIQLQCDKGVMSTTSVDCSPITPTVTISLTETCTCQHGVCVSCCPWTCSCHRSTELGFWLGENCDECVPGYYGPMCNQQCQGGTCNPCSGHGLCNEGLSGNGECTCSGNWAGRTCDACAVGYAGNSCDIRCKSCNNHGVCDPLTGSCLCESGFDSSVDCRTCLPGNTLLSTSSCVPSNPCQCDPIGGRCNLVTLLCECKTNFAGLLCNQCADPRTAFGDNCDQNCDCSNAGSCLKDGTCNCDKQHRGNRCKIKCDCSNHGTCESAISSTCLCDSSPSEGYWSGTSCNKCIDEYWGSTCSLTCNSGAGCGSNGRCYPNAKCGCDFGYCGAACDQTNCQQCSTEFQYGSTCSSTCLNQCSGHGHCDSGLTGTGACWCDSGYATEDCSVKCLLGTDDNICSGPSRGICSSLTGNCKCNDGFIGIACELTCSPDPSCSDHGTCSGNPPTCLCNAGYTGTDCSIPCSCGIHGVCDHTAGTCTCFGNFAKNSAGICNVCTAGFAGPTCEAPCESPNGISSTISTACICQTNFYGVSCNETCPGCNGRGQCVSEPICECDSDWYGPTCNVSCTATTCQNQGLQNAQCNALSGECECLASISKGYYSGSDCTSCLDGWWGVSCDHPCECNRAGTCDPNSGLCTCYRNKKQGYWSGARCGQCLEGYIGENCTQTASPPTRFPTNRYTSIDSNSLPIISMVIDDDSDVIITVSATHIYHYSTVVWPPQLINQVSYRTLANVRSILSYQGSVFDMPTLSLFSFKSKKTNQFHIVTARSGITFMYDQVTGNVAPQSVAMPLVEPFIECQDFKNDRGNGDNFIITKRDCLVLKTDGENDEIKVSLIGTAVPFMGSDCSYQSCQDSMNSQRARLQLNGTTLAVSQMGNVLLEETNNGIMANGWQLPALQGAPMRFQMIFDNATGNSFPITKYSTNPSSVDKISKTGWTGRHHQNKHPTEVIETASISEKQRILFGAGSPPATLIAFSLHDIISSEPDVADIRGGTVLTIKSAGLPEGSVSLNRVTCQYSESSDPLDNVITAFNGTSESVQCLAMATIVAECAGGYINLGIDGRYTTAENAKLQRYTPPVLHEVMGKKAGDGRISEVISINGTGYIQSNFIVCGYFLMGNSNPSIVSPGRMVGSSVVECDRPATQIQNLTTLDIALDGQIYTGNAIAYHIVGNAISLRVPSEYFASDLASNMQLNDLVVEIVDSSNHPVGIWDRPNKRTCVIIPLGGNASEPLYSFTVIDGRAKIPASFFLDYSGVIRFLEYDLLFKLTDNTDWEDSTSVTIQHGPPMKLKISSFPDNINSMESVVDFTTTLEDSRSYTTTTITGKTIRAQLYANGTATGEEWYSLTSKGVAKFTSIRLRLRASLNHTIVFTYENLESTSEVMVAPVCYPPSGLFQVENEYGCHVCPTEGVTCNGTTSLEIEPGFWSASVANHDNNTVIYRCRSSDVCLGSAASLEQCAESAGGALCQGCSEGWARVRARNKPCEKCDSGIAKLKAFAVASAMFLFAGVIIVLTVYNFYGICLLRTGLVYLQILGKFNEYNISLPAPLSSSLYLFSRLSLFDFSLYQPFNCIIRTYFPLLEIYMLFPLGSTLIACCVYIGIRKKLQLGFATVCLLSATAAYFLCFPTMLTHFLAYQKCEDYDYGKDGKISRLWVDVTIDCGGDEYNRRQIVAMLAAYFIGIVIPVAYLLLGIYKTGFKTSSWLAFIKGGFKPEFWYWPVIVLMRTSAIVAPALFTTKWNDERIQHYIASWAIQIGLLLQYHFSPFIDEYDNKFELLCLGILTIFMNLTFVFHVDDLPSGAAAFIANLLNLLLYSVILAFLFGLLPKKWKDKFNKKKKSDVEIEMIEQSDTSSWWSEPEDLVLKPIPSGQKLSLHVLADVTPSPLLDNNLRPQSRSTSAYSSLNNESPAASGAGRGRAFLGPRRGLADGQRMSLVRMSDVSASPSSQSATSTGRGRHQLNVLNTSFNKQPTW